MGQVTDQLGGFQKTAGKVGNLVKGLFVGVAVGQAVQGIKAVTKAASDSQQSLGATETVFGKYAKSVIDNSKRAATAIGLSANEYRELSNVTGALLSGAGMPLKQVAGLTDDLNKRAADMAATFGGTTREAVESISSLMKGEADPIEKYGVSIKQSDVNARLASKGLDKLTGEAKKQAEMQERLNLLMEKTNKTQGAFKKETNTLAHQQQVLGAQWDNLKATLGSALLPVFTSVLKFVNEQFNPAMSALADFLKPAVAAFKGLFEQGKSGQGALGPLVNFIQGQVVPAFQNIWGAVQNLWTVLQPILQQVATAFSEKWAAIAPTVENIFNRIKEIVTTYLAIVAQVISVVTTGIAYVWDRWGGQILGFLTTSFGNIAQFISGVLTAISGVFKTVLAVLKGDWKGAWDGIKQIVSGVWTAIKAIVKQALAVVKAAMSVAWAAIKAGVSALWSGIKAAFSAGINAVVNLAKGIKGKITGAFSSAGSWLKSAGADIVRGLGAGLESMWGWVMDKVHALTDKIPGWVKKRLGIASPSKVMKALGRWVTLGLAAGIADGNAVSRVEKVTKEITKKVAAKVDKTYKKMKAAQKKVKTAQIVKTLKDETKALTKNAKARDKAAKKIENAKKAYADLKKEASDYAKNIADGAKNYMSLGNLDSAFNAPSMLKKMADRVAKQRQFNAVLKDLINKGLNEDMVAELAQAGVEGGLAYALAIQGGGKEAVNQFNSLQTQANAAATELGTLAKNDMYAAGLSAADGLVKALEKSYDKLEKVAKKMAKTLTKALKKALKIKSPSRVFRDLGEFTVAGLEMGLADTNGVTKKVTNLATAMTGAFDPTLRATAVAPAGGSQITVNVNVPPTADKAAIGREIQKTLDAYAAKGGRVRAA